MANRILESPNFIERYDSQFVCVFDCHERLRLNSFYARTHFASPGLSS